MFDNQSDWRLPSALELGSLLAGSQFVGQEGYDKKWGVGEFLNEQSTDQSDITQNYIYSGSKGYKTNLLFTPNLNDIGNFWSFSSVRKSDQMAWDVSFQYGLSDIVYKQNGNYVRLVRSNQSIEGFEKSLNIVKSGDPAEQTAISISSEMEADRQEKARLAESERQKQLLRKNEATLPAQAMYLQAGKYERQGNSGDAKRLYETLIEKYPNHPLAIKANDQLQSMSTSMNSSRPSNTTCSHLYIGKAVSYKGCGALWCTTVEGVITGIGDGVATMRVTGSEYNGDVIEKQCSKF